MRPCPGDFFPREAWRVLVASASCVHGRARLHLHCTRPRYGWHAMADWPFATAHESLRRIQLGPNYLLVHSGPRKWPKDMGLIHLLGWVHLAVGQNKRRVYTPSGHAART